MPFCNVQNVLAFFVQHRNVFMLGQKLLYHGKFNAKNGKNASGQTGIKI
jgi:hypothetical protein